jgi:SAM-dependent methyltransferase
MDMNESTHRRVGSQEQFGRQAHYYTQSLVHSSGESLQVIQEWVAKGCYRLAADIGTGTGFTAFAVAPYADRIIAADITPAMLKETRSLAEDRGITNLECTLAAAEYLPFTDGSMDLLTCRTAAHHFQELGKAVAEWRRVLAPEAELILVDTSCPEDSATADWMNDVEVQRDPSHVRNLAPSEWLALLQAHGFCITGNALAPVLLEFGDWVQRSGTPASVVQSLRRDFVNAPSGAVEAFNIHQDESSTINFQWSCVVVRAVRRR